jgi:geranylgeranyl diphosphate synthase, type II
LSLKEYSQDIVAKIQANISLLGPPSKLREACEYALMNGGKRLRPALVLMVAKALSPQADVTHAALAIEYFHTASLVADDLPCMDDDDLRRSKPSTHKVYGETMALLASYALIAAGYAGYAKNAQTLKDSTLPHATHCDQICTLAVENASHNTGLLGATGGQFLDIFPENLSLPAIQDIIHKKTTSLFEIAFVSGWLYGGGDPLRLSEVKKTASHFGLAFQIADDLDDASSDASKGRQVNIASIIGTEAAQAMLRDEVQAYEKGIKGLFPQGDELLNLLK